MGSYSVVQGVRPLMGQPLCCSTADAGRWGERGYGDGSTPYTWLSSIALLPWLPGLPPEAPPITISALASVWSTSPQSTAALALGLLHSLQVPAIAPSRGPASLSEVCLAAAKAVWFSFPLGCHRSAVSLSALNVSPLTQPNAPIWGLDPCFSSSTGRGQVQSY